MKTNKKGNFYIMTNVEYASNYTCKHTYFYILVIMYERGLETFVSNLRRFEIKIHKAKSKFMSFISLKGPKKAFAILCETCFM